MDLLYVIYLNLGWVYTLFNMQGEGNLDEEEALREATSVVILAKLSSRSDVPTSEDYSKASRTLDSLKVLRPDIYKLRLAADNMGVECEVELGKVRYHNLLDDISTAVDQARQKYRDISTHLPKGMIYAVPHEAITGEAIRIASTYHRNGEVRPEIWGKIFAIYSCLNQLSQASAPGT